MRPASQTEYLCVSRSEVYYRHRLTCLRFQRGSGTRTPLFGLPVLCCTEGWQWQPLWQLLWDEVLMCVRFVSQGARQQWKVALFYHGRREEREVGARWVRVQGFSCHIRAVLSLSVHIVGWRRDYASEVLSKPDMVTHICNPSTQRGWGRTIESSISAWATWNSVLTKQKTGPMKSGRF